MNLENNAINAFASLIFQALKFYRVVQKLRKNSKTSNGLNFSSTGFHGVARKCLRLNCEQSSNLRVPVSS
jgi:hypothetical protein